MISAVSDKIDLSKINFEALKKEFEKGRKHIQIEKLRGELNQKLIRMLRFNKVRIDYYEHFQKMIEEYNNGVTDEDAFFAKLISFAKELSKEEQRGIAENLSEEELAIFDLLTRPEMKLNREEKEKVKKVAHDLLDTLKAERLVLDWRKKQQTRAAVQLTIEQILDELPKDYSKDIYKTKCGAVYQHIYDSYWGENKSIYTLVS
jgi:type I restriction enzyme R subunit